SPLPRLGCLSRSSGHEPPLAAVLLSAAQSACRHLSPSPHTSGWEPLRRTKANRSPLVQDLCDADVFRPVGVGQNSQSLLFHILAGPVVGETKQHRLTPSCI